MNVMNLSPCESFPPYGDRFRHSRKTEKEITKSTQKQIPKRFLKTHTKFRLK